VPEFAHLISSYGIWFVAGIIALESMGLPLPGEAALIAMAIFAGTTDTLSIWAVLAAAVASAIVGSVIGFWMGRQFGYPPLVKYGHHVRLTEARIKIGQYLIFRYGSNLVFAARFVPVMRNLAGILAGVNCMHWWRFMFANATGATAWATSYGLTAYYLGEQSLKLASPVLASVGILLLLITVGLGALVVRYEKRLVAAAAIALPGSLSSTF
jgi:membrane protein DedA with SNARE-associated domain